MTLEIVHILLDKKEEGVTNSSNLRWAWPKEPQPAERPDRRDLNRPDKEGVSHTQGEYAGTSSRQA